MKQIAVAMMVKNEAHIIERCLGSLLPIEPDLVVIMDTGSTDQTIVKAGIFLQLHNLKFQIYQEPFKNFGTNRTQLLQLVRKDQSIDYTFMIDADDLIQYRGKFNARRWKEGLVTSIQTILYSDGVISYHLPKLTSNHINFNYIGVTHEYLDTQGVNQSSPDDLWVKQGCDSFRRLSGQKHTNDIFLLTQALESEQNETIQARYWFYLGQAYYANSNYPAAISAYQKRLVYQGWVEEIFYSYYQLGKIYQSMGEIAFKQAFDHYLAAYYTCPSRIESLVSLKSMLSNNILKYMVDSLDTIIKNTPCPAQGLFLEKYKYENVR